jgi:RNA polymerase sporulation-specific sigma factor
MWDMNCELQENRSSRDETYRLIQEAKNGSEEAKERLIIENTGLVNMAARKFLSSGNEFEDLMQLGYIGLIKAIERFDPSYGVMFSTYAVPMIIGEIRRFLRDDGRLKMSRQLKQEVKLMKKAEEDFLQKNGRSPRLSELADMMKCSVEKIAELTDAKNIMSGIASMDDENFTAACAEPAADESENRHVEIIDIRDMIGSLDTKERSVIIMRYFKDMTQQQTGAALGISQVQVSRIEKRVLSEMRDRL